MLMGCFVWDVFFPPSHRISLSRRGHEFFCCKLQALVMFCFAQLPWSQAVEVSMIAMARPRWADLVDSSQEEVDEVAPLRTSFVRHDSFQDVLSKKCVEL